MNLHIPDVAESLAKRRSKDKSRKALSSVKQARRAAKYRNTANNSEEASRAYNRHDGGLQPEEPDVSSEELQTRRISFMKP